MHFSIRKLMETCVFDSPDNGSFVFLCVSVRKKLMETCVSGCVDCLRMNVSGWCLCSNVIHTNFDYNRKNPMQNLCI
jgi:hypothetical protein